MYSAISKIESTMVAKYHLHLAKSRRPSIGVPYEDVKTYDDAFGLDTFTISRSFFITCDPVS